MFEEMAMLVLGKGIPYSLMAITSLIIFDAIFGVLLSIKVGDFDLEKVKRFLATNILPYIGGLGLLALGAMYVAPEFFSAVYSLVATLVVIGYLKSLYAKLQNYFGVEFTYDCIECGENFLYDAEAFTTSPGPKCPDCRGVVAEEEEEGAVDNE